MKKYILERDEGVRNVGWTRPVMTKIHRKSLIHRDGLFEKMIRVTQVNSASLSKVIGNKIRIKHRLDFPHAKGYLL